VVWNGTGTPNGWASTCSTRLRSHDERRHQPADAAGRNRAALATHTHPAHLRTRAHQLGPGRGAGDAGGETATIAANWVATSQRDKTSYRFTAITNCDNSQCTAADQQHKFKITATGTGDSVDAAATARVNGVDLGPSTNDPSLGQTFLASGDQSTIEYGGSYPIDIYPIQAPKAP
jgi:hypothetical protein